ncbi:MAG: VTT domain-containing protein [Clostridia bacterium]|nr:VTT domain-containing protein [Clostridia bacterium]
MSIEFFSDMIYSWGAFGFLASILLNVLIAVSGILPSIFITGANVLVFGPVKGFIISWAGEVIGASIVFQLYRLGFKKNFEGLGRKHKLLGKIAAANGYKAYFLLFEARLLPFLPSGLVTLAGALSNVGFIYFLIATALGKLPSLALETLISYDLISFNKNWIRLIITVLVAGSIILMAKKSRSGKPGIK